jgi:hypothetical protein
MGDPLVDDCSVPLIFGCLLSTLRFLERPDHAKRDALLSGLAGGAVAAFRPLDAAILLITSAAGIFIGVLRSRTRNWRVIIWGPILYAASSISSFTCQPPQTQMSLLCATPCPDCDRTSAMPDPLRRLLSLWSIGSMRNCTKPIPS